MFSVEMGLVDGLVCVGRGGVGGVGGGEGGGGDDDGDGGGDGGGMVFVFGMMAGGAWCGVGDVCVGIR